jgi:hypothetical protein
LMAALAPHAVEAAIAASELVADQSAERLQAIRKELEDANYSARLAQRRYEAVDPDRRLVARELERRWEDALKCVRELVAKVDAISSEVASTPAVDREVLLALARDLPRVWNATGDDNRAKQRIVRALIQEVVVDVDDDRRETVAVIHWTGGRHTEIRIARNRSYYPNGFGTNPVDAVRALAPRWSDLQIAVTLNRARCRTSEGVSWTEFRVRALREKLGIAPYDPQHNPRTTVSADEAARRLSVCVGSVMKLIGDGTLPATQAMPGAPWEIPAAALTTGAVRRGVQAIQKRRPRTPQQYQDAKTLRLPLV